MNIVVFGARGIVGQSIADAFEAAGHSVRRLSRQEVDFRHQFSASDLQSAVRGADIVVNAVGILIERNGNTWTRVHAQAAAGLAQACAVERVARIIQISALGVGRGLGGGYMASKLAAEVAILSGPVDCAVVRPALFADPHSRASRLFDAVAAWPVIPVAGCAWAWAALARALGRGPTRESGEAPQTDLEARFSCIHTADIAQCVLRIALQPRALRRVIELGGPQDLTYREMMDQRRAARVRPDVHQRPPLWLPVPWWLVQGFASLAARLSPLLDQRIISPETARDLRVGCISQCSESAQWLGREPSALIPAARSASLAQGSSAGQPAPAAPREPLRAWQ